jgi:hypothetical protein
VIAVPRVPVNDDQSSRQRARSAHRRLLIFGAGLAAPTAAVVALALTLPGASGPSLAQAAALGLLPAAAPAPAPQTAEPRLLQLSVDGVPFPAFAQAFGWQATGAREDTLDDRRAATVFYENGGRQIAYTIVSGGALALPRDVTHVTREETDLHVAQIGGRLVVTWQRNGRTCILTGPGIDRDTLLELAAWRGMGAIPF